MRSPNCLFVTIALALGAFLSPTPAAAQVARTFFVTAASNNTLNWTVDGQPDPTLALTRGLTYEFQLQNVPANHPFSISQDGLTEYSQGVTNNGATGTATVVFSVPLNAPDSMYYVCTVHPDMIGLLSIVTSPSIFGNGFEGPG